MYKARLQELGVNEVCGNSTLLLVHRFKVKQFIKETVTAGIITAKKLCTAFGVKLPAFWEGRQDSSYYRLLGLALLRESSYRKKLTQFNNIDDAVSLLHKSKNIMVITGAGVCQYSIGNTVFSLTCAYRSPPILEYPTFAPRTRGSTHNSKSRASMTHRPCLTSTYLRKILSTVTS